MDVESVERQLREQLEIAVGRRLSDDEWETFKRIQLQSAQTGLSDREPAAWQWTRTDKAACIAALVAALAGVSLLLQWDFVFSPFVRVPLGVFVLLIALAVFGFWFTGLFRPPFGFVDLAQWLWWGFFFGVFVLLPFAVAGWALLSEDRDYLTSTHEWFGEEGTPAELLGWVLLLASILLAVGGRPTRSGRR